MRRCGEDTIDIGVLLPDVLGTYGDSGNAEVLARRLRWRGYPVRVVPCGMDRPPPVSCALYVLGGGEDVAQLAAARWLRGQRALLRMLANSAVTLAVCAGLQVLGTVMVDRAGRTHAGAGVLDLTTVPRRRRAVGEMVVRSGLPGVGVVRGFENHRGATQLGPGLTPFGTVLAGVGNATRGRGDGVCTPRVVGTYLHGPVLARNPALADALLQRVLGVPLAELPLSDRPSPRPVQLRDVFRRRRIW
jgi:hypothetical protein